MTAAPIRCVGCLAALAVALTAAGHLAAEPTPALQQNVALPDRPPAYPGYALVWADEFAGDGQPDAANWTYEEGFVRNQELQWYRRENARVRQGLLVIEARRERVANPRFDAASYWLCPRDGLDRGAPRRSPRANPPRR